MACFYFDFNDINKRSSNKAVRSLLFQVGQRTHDGRNTLEQLYQQHNSGQHQPSEAAIQHLLQDILASYGSKFIVLDALDECTDQEDFVRFLRDTVALKGSGLRILATSRRERLIEEHLGPIATYNVNIRTAVVDEDIRVYVQHLLLTDPKLKKWPDAVQGEIAGVLMKKAGGM